MRRCSFLVFCLLCLFGLGACASQSSPRGASHSSQLVTGSFEQIQIPPYSEYEVLGLVFATTSEYDKIDTPAQTYLALLKKAADMGGHAIVNVSIEESRNCVKLNRPQFPYREGETACEITRFGSALAIRYTKIITDPKIIKALDPNHLDVEGVQISGSVAPTDDSKSGKSGLSIF